MLVYEKCECFVMQMLYVCYLCASCGRPQCRLSSDPTFSYHPIFPTFSSEFILFVLVSHMLFQHALNYCYSVCITCTIIMVNVFP